MIANNLGVGHTLTGRRLRRAICTQIFACLCFCLFVNRIFFTVFGKHLSLVHRLQGASFLAPFLIRRLDGDIRRHVFRVKYLIKFIGDSAQLTRCLSFKETTGLQCAWVNANRLILCQYCANDALWEYKCNHNTNFRCFGTTMNRQQLFLKLF